MKIECDIILLSYENPELLKKCVESVLKFSGSNSRLIIIDNNSKSPEVRRYIFGLENSGKVPVEKVFNEKNEGFAAGMNKGMRLSTAPYICILNNDCVVTDGWLEEMISIAASRHDVGLVNPSSNTFGDLPPDGVTLDEHAAASARHKGEYVELGHAIGFACLIKREVVEKIGYLDEAYEGVCYEDTDYSVRAQRAGYRSVMARGAYVAHVEQASRGKLKGRKEIYRKNRELFESRWGTLLRVLFLSGREQNTRGISGDYEKLKELARQRVMIDMWVNCSASAADIFSGRETGGVIKHADIGIKTFQGGWTLAGAIWKIVTKKKKYSAVIAPCDSALFMLRIAGALRNIKVFSIGADGKLKNTCGRDLSIDDAAGLANYLRRKY